ncbi:MAG: ABC transporter permease [Anaerolineae bacterium]|nr:ABC transporter permease [Anaerolineae bacterium]
MQSQTLNASPAEPSVVQIGPRPLRSESLTRRALRRFRRHRLAMFGLLVLNVLILLSALAPQISRHSPYDFNLQARAVEPSGEHWLGTDRTGRDLWARVVLGGRVSLSVGIVAVALSTTLGVAIGSLAGYFGGTLDMLLMRFTDMVMTFPSLIILITLVAVLEPSIYNSMLAIGLLSWPGLARIVRGQFLSLRQAEFVTAAHCLGVPAWRIILLHILPNTLGPIIVAATFGMGSAILLEAGLSFLGLGVQPPQPSWGNMLRDAASPTTLESMPWMWVPPGVLIIISVLSVNFIGDGLRDAFDPRSDL